MSLIMRFDSFIRKHRLIEPNTNLTVALSGGPDSVALLALARSSLTLRKMRVCVLACHINHGMRSESAAEERLVRALCRSLGVPLAVFRLGLGRASESAARAARIAALASCAKHIASTTVATAHTADDQTETLLLRLLRASPPNPIPPKSRLHGVNFVHPLLWAKKEELIEQLNRQGLGYILDETNYTGRNMRARIRREAVPVLCGLRKGFVEGCARAAQALMVETAAPFVRKNFFGLEEVHVAASDVYSGRGHAVFAAAAAALSCPPPDREHLAQILALPRSGGCVDIRSTLRCTFEDGHFVLWRPEKPYDFSVELPIPGEVRVPGCLISARRVLRLGVAEFVAGKTRFIEALPPDIGSLTLRRVRKDDEFIPFGRSRPVGVVGFLKGEGVPERRRRWAVVLEAGGRIVWVVGVRLDARFRVADGPAVIVEARCDA